MTKYIIELEDDIKYLIINGRADNRCYTLVRPVDELEELNSDYINEHYGQLQDEAYQRGLEDAWDAARKIIHMPEGDLLNIFTECYSAVCTALQVLLKYDASEAIAKLKAYEDKHSDRIEVGDEVISNFGIRYVVTYCSPLGAMCGVSKNGTWCNNPYDKVTKTGKHYDIQSILEAMRTND